MTYLNPHSTLGELDLYLIGEGRHEKLWEVLGAHIQRDSSGELLGTTFALWAPNAAHVSLVCDANFWDRNTHKMVRIGSSGIWEIFIPDLGAGLRYKFAIHQKDGRWVDHADPLAAHTETPPLTASVVFESGYNWKDGTWLSEREKFEPWRQPVSIYEVHLGSWKLGLSYQELAHELIAYVTKHGFTHVEFLPVMEHPYGPSWGYQVTSFFAPTSRFGNPDDFRFLIDQLHSAGIGVILDWVPAHFPKDEWALAKFDGTALYEHADPRLGEHPDWGTLIFNFGRNEVRNFLVASALYWLTEFHIDGLRVDAVASMLYLDYSRKAGEWLPNKDGGRENLEAVQLLKEATSTAYRTHPGIMMIAEESTAWSGVSRGTDSGGLGFGFKWNMGWMHDTLTYLQHDAIHRVYHHNEITFSILYAWSENYVLPISHDEVVHGKGALVNKFPGDRWQKLATLRALYGYMWAHPGKKLLFMGCEFAQNDEWSESQGLQWDLVQYQEHSGVQASISELNSQYKKLPALWQKDTSPEGFTWLVGQDAASNILAFARWDDSGKSVVCITNFSPVPHERYSMPLPLSGTWVETFNSDDLSYGGSGIKNDSIVADSLSGNIVQIQVPPLATIWLVQS
ncbi:MAG: 1,4-alpha-glucan branching protein GlgB [Actinobacteria bacterium]|uniref:1,4-alpha-glucan branching enzyme n=1 Tax=freshwater metagenome TaxID=449393 RepID=A0A6J7E253_9ZZZZ|nr:1,4-alpha-glucan branching protein GlgB [Actinomycetota bacterium]MSX25378.1 1,4-alpha-glucan branching protein GlgB [Actinomycetota bacterium]MSY46351.1 1,4-alpha-glucan branching protein GlgB [Actinomycetota bacterium]MSY57246.1 1,4-alpha-glucan branching protein GlgB [Actinomycetota bacterium]